MKIIKRIGCLVLVLVLVSGIFSGCATHPVETDPEKLISTEEADIWCAPASMYVLATIPAEDYAQYRTSTVSFVSAKNEYETGQIIVSAKEEVTFSVSVSDLVHTSDSSAVIGSDNFSIYTQHYTSISDNLYGNGAPTGDYPDALIPQSNAIEFGLNKIEAGRNGAAYLELFVPKDAKTGEYTGTASVRIGEGVTNVPITLKVYDVTVPDKTSSQSLFVFNGSGFTYELDSTGAVRDKYMEFLIKHRISADSIQTKYELAQEGDTETDVWARTAAYWYDKGLSTIAIQGGSAQVDGYSCFSPERVKASMISLAKVSLAAGYNYCEDAVLWDWSVDEPFYQTFTAQHMQHNIDTFDAMVSEIAAEVAAMDGFDSELGKQIVQSCLELPHIITDYMGFEQYYHAPMYFEDGTLFTYNGKNVALCPKFDGYDTQEMRDRYNDLLCDEKWFYGCNTPKYPYPEYHIDCPPVGPISIGWMMAQYGVVGNLYWCINYFLGTDGKPVEDPYNYNNTSAGSNGEGTLIYPGKVYGVDGPVGSVRLSAILDGNEDYEIIRLLQKKYEEKGLSCDDILSRISSAIYNGTRMVGGTTEYEQARELLLRVVEAAASDAELLISQIKEQVDENGVRTYAVSVSVADGVTLKANGEVLSAVNGIYELTCGLDEAKNYLILEASGAGITQELSIYLGGMQKIYTADKLAEQDFSGSYASGSLTDGSWKFRFEPEGDKKLTLVHESAKSINSDTLSYTLELSNYGGEASYKVYITYSKFGRVEYAQGQLLTGENKIVLDGFNASNWNRNGTVEEIQIVFDGTDSVGISKIIVLGA